MKNHQTPTVSHASRSNHSFHSKNRHQSKRKRKFSRVVHVTIRPSIQVVTRSTSVHQSVSQTSSKSLTNQTHSNTTVQIHRPISPQKVDLVNDHHRYYNSKKTKKKSWFNPFRCCLISFLTFIIILTIAVVIGVLIILRFPSKAKTIKPSMAYLRWNRTGVTILGVTGQAGSSSNQLHYPRSLAIDSLYNFYIGDYGNNRIQKCNLLYNLNMTTVAGRTDGQPGSNGSSLNEPGFLQVDSNENMYIPDTVNHRVQFWSRNALSGVTIAGVTGVAGPSLSNLNSPNGVTCDPISGTLYVSDTDNNRILRWDPGATSGVVVAGNNGAGITNSQLYSPQQIQLDTMTNSLLIANYGANNTVRWVLGDSKWSLLSGNINGSAGASSTSLQRPHGIIYDVFGNIYVADDQNHRIQFFPLGQSEGITIAGITDTTGTYGTYLNYPTSMVLDNQLNLYVADQGNERIQLFKRY